MSTHLFRVLTVNTDKQERQGNMVAFVFSIIIAVIAIIALGVAVVLNQNFKRTEDDDLRFGRNVTGLIGGVAAIGAGLLLFFGSILVSNGVGEAKVFTNPDGTIAFTQTAPGFTQKAPWQDYVDFDLFSQEVLYAGGDQAPSYSGGTVQGREVTVAVGGLNGGSTQANLDISVTYSLDADAAEAIYTSYKSQERFTKQVIEKTVLSVIRQVPGAYTATEFRGEARQEASDKILKLLNEKLNDLGVTVDFVNLQDIRYPENVEAALADVEAANQAALKAEANQRTAQVDAETKRIEAQGIADANSILDQSLTPEILQQKYIEALGEGTVYVVPDGSTPFVGTK